MPRSSFGSNLNGVGRTFATLNAVDERWGGTARWVVGTSVEYSVHVEFGTSRMQAQPYLRPAVKQTMRNGDAIADQASNTAELVRLLALGVESRAKHLAPVDTGTLRASLTATRIS